MAALHGALGTTLLVLSLILAAGAGFVFLAGSRRLGAQTARLVDGLWLVALGAAALAFLIGPLLLATGRVLADPLHAVYGIVALLSLPLLTVIGVVRSPGEGHHASRYAWMAAGALVTAALALRLLQTG